MFIDPRASNVDEQIAAVNSMLTTLQAMLPIHAEKLGEIWTVVVHARSVCALAERSAAVAPPDLQQASANLSTALIYLTDMRQFALEFAQCLRDMRRANGFSAPDDDED